MPVIDDLSMMLPVAAFVCAIMYAFLHLLLAAGIFRHRTSTGSRRPPGKISVLIAARNEAVSIATTLHALLQQTVQPDEVIVADDRSTDATAEIVSGIARDHPHVRLVSISSVPDGIAPKKHALQTAIKASCGDILCFTDADCIPPKEWLASLVSAFDDRTGVVVGTYVPHSAHDAARSISHRLLRSFIRYEKLRATLLAIGALEVGHPWMASGASFAYRREVFDEVGGYGDHLSALSGDDDLFLQQVRTKTRWKIRSVLSDRAAVLTHVPDTFGEFVQQRKRHFSAGRSYARSTQLLLFLYHASNIVSLSALVAWFFFPSPMLLGAYAVKVSADLLFFASAERHISRSRDWALFLLMEFLYALYIAGIGTLGRFGTPAWKEEPVS